MIVTKTPFRITLGGGGTDIPSYYSKYGGFIFSAGINKYMFISVSQPAVDNLIRLKYAQSEIVEKLDEIKHELAREILRAMNIDNGIEITSTAHIPAGTGLGSSSCYAVGLLHALHVLRRDYVPLWELAEKDFKIESEILKRPIGKQDPYLAAFGGLTVLDINKDGNVKVRKANVSPETAEHLNRNLLMFFTGSTRKADDILTEQVSSIQKNDKEVIDSMHYIKELGYKILEAAETGNITKIGQLFDQHWQYKKRISTKMSNPEFDKIYNIAKENGALGGKISGAGGGGFFLFYVENNHRRFREIMRQSGLREMRYHFDFGGTKILVED